MATALIDSVLHWKRKLEKNQSDDYILNVIRKLSKVPITLEILEATHIGKTIRKLSKRADIVGITTKALLDKWREIFTNQGSDKNQKFPSISKKENVDKEFSEKTFYSQKHEGILLSPNLAEPSNKYMNGSCNVNSSIDSSPSLYKCDVKEMNSNYMDYDPHTESSEGYNPECPELFPTNKYMKTKKPVLFETYEPSSMKRSLPDEKQSNENKSHYKKLKSSNHSNSNFSNIIELKESEKNNKNSLSKEKNDNSCSSILNKEAIKKFHYESAKAESDMKKIKFQESSESERTKSKKTEVKIHSSEEFTSSEVSFEDCLVYNDIVSIKKNTKLFSSPKKQSCNSPSKEIPGENNQKNLEKAVIPEKKINLLYASATDTKKEKRNFIVPKPASKLDVADITSTLPQIQPNYRPLPRIPGFHTAKKKEVLSNEEAIMFTSSRREKTAVYSGRKSYSHFTEIPTLFEMCTRILCENIDAIECIGSASFEMMLPILERCSPSQLYNIENFNPGFINDTNHLWKLHCRRDYKLQDPMEHESWRDLYWRAHDEQEKKLKVVTANISALMSKSTPIRQVKLAYVDSYVKPPRDIARKQAKNGTAAPFHHVKKSTQTPKSTALASSSTTRSSNSASSSASKKPKIAPLMAKTLKSMRAFRRK